MTIELDPNVLHSEIERLKEVVKITAAKLMVAHQTVQELLKGHLELRSALTLAQSQEGPLKEFVDNLLKPQVPQSEPEVKVAEAVEQTAPVVEQPVANADTISA